MAMYKQLLDVTPVCDMIRDYLRNDGAWFSRVFWRRKPLTKKHIFDELVKAYREVDLERVTLLTKRHIHLIKFSEAGKNCLLEASGSKTARYQLPLPLPKLDGTHDKWKRLYDKEDILYVHDLYHAILKCPKRSVEEYVGKEPTEKYKQCIEKILSNKHWSNTFFGGVGWMDLIRVVTLDKTREEILHNTGHFSHSGCVVGGIDTTECCIRYDEEGMFVKKHLTRIEGDKIFMKDGGSIGEKYDIDEHNRILNLCAQTNPKFLRFILPAGKNMMKTYLEGNMTPHREEILKQLGACGIPRSTVGYPYGNFHSSSPSYTWREFVSKNTGEVVKNAIRFSVDVRDERALNEIIQHKESRVLLYSEIPIHNLSSFRSTLLVEDGISYFREKESTEKKQEDEEGDKIMTDYYGVDQKVDIKKALLMEGWGEERHIPYRNLYLDDRRREQTSVQKQVSAPSRGDDFVLAIMNEEMSAQVLDWLASRYSSEKFFQEQLNTLYTSHSLYGRDNLLAQRVIYHISTIHHVHHLVETQATLATVEIAMRKCKQDINVFISTCSKEFQNGEQIILGLQLLPGRISLSTLARINEYDVDKDVMDEGEMRYKGDNGQVAMDIQP